MKSSGRSSPVPSSGGRRRVSTILFQGEVEKGGKKELPRRIGRGSMS